MQPVIIPYEGSLPSGTASTILLPANWAQRVLKITGVSVANLDHTMTQADVGVRQAGLDIIQQSLVIATAGLFYTTTQPMYIMGDSSIVVKTAGGTTGDRIVVNVFGVVEYDPYLVA